MKVRLGVSNHHVHLCEDDFNRVFNNRKLEKDRELTQIGEFASNLRVTLKTEKGVIQNVRVVGPFRDYTQVEISKTDAYNLGLNPPVRDSGNLIGSEDITIIGDNEIFIPECCIIANRHIHANKEDLIKYNLNPNKKYSVQISGEKGGILDNVSIKVSDNFVFEMHIDTDDANAHLLNSGSEGIILEK